MSPASTPSLAALADGADQLYSLPSVALEVIRLTESPKVDARALCDCLQGDPALAAKVLRVVNSSLYGLPREIGSLSDAIAILGVQPLKMLVLGFALPDRLFDNLTGDALRRYWTETLTTATAARAMAELGWGRLGDEALVAGLMQGVGQLALVGQLGDEYASLIEATARRPPRPARSVLPLERQALGFEHPALSAELVRRWSLPERLAVAIESQCRDDLSPLEGDTACLAQSLRLANLLTRLVAGGELMVLRELVDEADEYAAVSKRQINDLVETLQEKVAQLAGAMAVELADGTDYTKTLLEAHKRLSLLSENSAVRMLSEARTGDELDEDEALATELLTETRRLSAAVRVYLAGGTGPRTDQAPETPAQRPGPSGPHTVKTTEQLRERLVESIREAAVACREQREGLSLCLIQLDEQNAAADADVVAFRQWLRETDLAADFARAFWNPIARDRIAVLLPALERTDATRLLTQVADRLADSTPLRLHAGVAGVGQVSRGFEPAKLLEPAERCLSAAVAPGGPTIKSLEVF